jgi:hypothetical protein
MPERPKLSDEQVRMLIMRAYYRAYQEHGLHVIMMASEAAQQSGLTDPAQIRRCFDYLVAKQLIRPMTRGGGYSPTVELVDAIEQSGDAEGAVR